MRVQIRCTARPSLAYRESAKYHRYLSTFDQAGIPWPNLASNSDTLVTVFGGSGFLGRHVVRALAKRDYRIRVGGAAAGTGRPSAAARPGRPDPCRAGQSALSGLGRGGDARRQRRDQSGRHPDRERRADASTPCRPRAPSTVAQGGQRRRRAHGACLGDRRRREFALALCAAPRPPARRPVLAAVPSATDHAAVGGVRARGPVHQPLRRAGADVAGRCR